MLRLANIDVDALSIGGLRTCIQLPGMDLAFDMGTCPQTAISRRTVLFSHAHLDHMGGVVLHCASRDLMGMAPPTYVVPPENEAQFLAMMDAWRALSHSALPCTVRAIAPGDEFQIRNNLIAQPLRAIHRVPTQGYVLTSKRNKLKPQYHGLPGDEIRQARQRGEDITDTISVPEVAFTGDSQIGIFDRNPVLFSVKLLLVEVTFVGDEVPPASARKKGHIHLDEIIERADQFNNEAILFTHLSPRYNPKVVQEIIDKRLPKTLRERVTLLGFPQ